MLNYLRKDLLLVLSAAALFLSLSYAIGRVSERSPKAAELRPSFLVGESAPKAQPGGGRVWKEHTFEKTFTIDKTAVSDPLTLRVGENGNVYVLDWADFRIKMFSPAGGLVQTYGSGKGTGAGAFLSPTSISVGPGGELWVCDPRQQKITRFDARGEVRAVLPQSPTDRIATVGDFVVAMSGPGADTLFEVYSQSGERLKSFGEVVADQRKEWIALDGSVVGDEEGRGFIYGGRYLGVLAGFGADGEKRFVVQTVDGATRPVILDYDGRHKINPSVTHAVLSLSVAEDKLYVLSAAPGEGEAGRVLDAYDKRDGRYLYSVKLPFVARQAFVKGGRIYALNKDGVTAWRMKPNA